MTKRPFRARPRAVELLESRKLLHSGHDHLSGMLDGLARAADRLAASAIGNHAPSAPEIREPHIVNQRVAPNDVHMETGPMVDADAGDTHLASDFVIALRRGGVVWRALNVEGLEKVHVHLGDGQFVGKYAGRTALKPNLNYVLRIRHRDSSGDPETEWSAWSSRPFRTTAAKVVSGRGGVVMNGWRVLKSGYRVEVAASGFQLPVAIAFVPNAGSAPDVPLYYVAELYGTIKTVTRDGSVSVYADDLLNFNPTGNFPGSGETGLAGLVVDATSGDVFATMLYADAHGDHHPKVVHFTSADGGRTAATETTILDISNEAQGASHQISHISFGPDGKLYVHVGDGMVPASARDRTQFRGKILRVNTDGSAPGDNPFYDSSDGITATDYIFASGFRNPFGGAWRASDGALYEVENGPSQDRVAKVVRGRDYGWNDTNASMKLFAAYNWNPAVAPVNIVFVQPQTQGGSGFPVSSQGHAYVTESGPTYASGAQARGKRVVEFTFDAQGKTRGPVALLKYAGKGKATAAALAAGPDGLYFSELYADAGNNPTAAGARVLRIRYTGPQPFIATSAVRSRR